MRQNNIKIGSNKSFGFLFFIVFFLISIYPLINSEGIRIWSLAVSLIFLVLGAINSKLLNPLNKVWFKIGFLLSRITSPILMGIIFYLIVTPIALLMRILKKDLLNLKFNKNNTYWFEKSGPKSKMKNQF